MVFPLEPGLLPSDRAKAVAGIPLEKLWFEDLVKMISSA